MAFKRCGTAMTFESSIIPFAGVGAIFNCALLANIGDSSHFKVRPLLVISILASMTRVSHVSP